jgi:hypothetical protein
MRLSGVLHAASYRQSVGSAPLAAFRPDWTSWPALCGQWGNIPTSTGKTVWAKISPDETIGGFAELQL